MAAKETVQAPVTKKSRWDMMVPITLPRGEAKGSKVKYVKVNARSYTVPLGKTTMVPLPVQEILIRSMKAEDAVYKFIQENNNTTEL